MIDEKQILHLEALARIQLTEEQRVIFSQEISRILDYMDRLATINLSIAPTEEMEIATCSGRADELRESLSREMLLAMSPEATSEYMTVPRTVI
jgi:aspartyl-tRNA(Asn)/glutamyl-tRNA(Gln) amidotransferase subunit C